jgi:hypothetical protein
LACGAAALAMDEAASSSPVESACARVLLQPWFALPCTG